MARRAESELGGGDEVANVSRRLRMRRMEDRSCGVVMGSAKRDSRLGGREARCWLRKTSGLEGKVGAADDEAGDERAAAWRRATI